MKKMIPSCMFTATALMLTATTSATLVTNGEFEDSEGAFSTAGWDLKNNIVVSAHAPLFNDSSAAAYVARSSSTSADRLEQSLNANSVGQEWVFEMYFATEDVGSSSRGLNLILPFLNSTGYNQGQINLRVNGNGAIQAYNSGSNGWSTVFANGSVSGSIDSNNNASFADEGDTLNVHRLRLVGKEWGTANARYDVLLSDANGSTFTMTASDLTLFQNDALPDLPAEGGINRLQFDTQNSFGAYVIDGVSFQVIPEPSAFSLLALGGMVLLRRRRG